MTGVGVRAHSLHQLIRRASGEIKQSQCCVCQSKKPQIPRQWTESWSLFRKVL